MAARGRRDAKKPTKKLNKTPKWLPLRVGSFIWSMGN